MKYIAVSETFINLLIHCNTLKFQEKRTSLLTGQKSALQQSLFWCYANFFQINAHRTYLHGQYF